MHNQKGKKGWMTIKIDSEKAYDRLHCPFVKETLEYIGFPTYFITIVWHCISSPSMCFLWNGEALESFHPSCGIRQGGPLSPYLFVLCMERLSHLISLAVENNSWASLQLW